MKGREVPEEGGGSGGSGFGLTEMAPPRRGRRLHDSLVIKHYTHP